LPKWNPTAKAVDQLSMIMTGFTCTAVQTILAAVTCSFTGDVLALSGGFLKEWPKDTILEFKVSKF
jgi:hypothetical protein